MRARAFALTACLLASPATTRVYGQEPPAARLGPIGFVGSLDGITTEFRPSVGSTTGIGSRGWGVGLSFGATVLGYVIGGADIGFVSVADDSSFTQSTTGGQRESSAALYYASFYAGIKTREIPLIRSRRVQFALGALAGRAGWSGGRSISNCVDCNVERFPLVGGAFVEPFLIIGRRDGVFFRGVRVAMRSYRSSDASVDNVISVGLGSVRGR